MLISDHGSMTTTYHTVSFLSFFFWKLLGLQCFVFFFFIFVWNLQFSWYTFLISICSSHHDVIMALQICLSFLMDTKPYMLNIFALLIILISLCSNIISLFIFISLCCFFILLSFSAGKGMIYQSEYPVLMILSESESLDTSLKGTY